MSIADAHRHQGLQNVFTKVLKSCMVVTHLLEVEAASRSATDSHCISIA